MSTRTCTDSPTISVRRTGKVDDVEGGSSKSKVQLARGFRAARRLVRRGVPIKCKPAISSPHYLQTLFTFRA